MIFNRRTFAGISIKALAIAVFSPFSRLVRAQEKKVKKMAIPLAKAEDLKEVGGWTILKIKDSKLIFIRDTKTSVRVLSAVCTHQSCDVKFKDRDNKLHCPCHRSQFDLDGKVLNGPATKDLQKYEATLEDDKVILTLEVQE